MDTFTHALSGAIVGASGASLPAERQRRLRERMLWGFLFAAFPDADFLLLFFTDTFTYLNEHRGYTHSVVMLPVWAVLLGALASRITRESFRSMALLAAAAIAAHIAGDLITSWGTKLFKPLSDVPLAWPITFIIDPVFTGILLAGVIGVLWKRRRWPAMAAGAALLCWLSLQAVMHSQAEQFGREYAAQNGLKDAVVVALPQPLSPFRWKVVVAAGGNYHRSYVDLIAGEVPAEAGEDAGLIARLNAAYRPPEDAYWQVYPRWPADPAVRGLARAAWQQPEFEPYRRFALLPYVSEMKMNGKRLCVWSTDLRFTLPGREHPFEYAMCRDESGAWNLNMNAAESQNGE